MSRKFQVSRAAVRKHALAEGWDDRVAGLDAKARQATDERLATQQTVRLDETRELIDLARATVLEKLRAGEIEVKLSDLPPLLKLDLLLSGEATERVEIREVQLVITAVFNVAGQFVPKERRLEFKAAMDQAIGGLLAIEDPAASTLDAVLDEGER